MARTRVTGPGICLVKCTYYEESSAFRHFNELLFVISQLRHKAHFVDSKGMLKPHLLLTVDGGGDERPRNKMTKFLTTALRWLLNFDRVKVQSFAEYDSKLHSFERLRSAEGRALSQPGEISSHTIHKHETDDRGLHLDAKMMANMNFAAEEVVARLDGTPFASGVIHSLRSPSPETWLFAPELEGLIRNFLRNDSDRHRLRTDFELTPTDGIIWANLKETYSVADPGSISARSIYRNMTNPDGTWSQQYAFTVYLSDEKWRESRQQRYEVQPILDVGRLSGSPANTQATGQHLPNVILSVGERLQGDIGPKLK